jgi:NosR/NirI family transcriptional regulator, nitrous oxide reductase regulator
LNTQIKVFFFILLFFLSCATQASQLLIKNGWPFCESYQCGELFTEADHFEMAKDLELPVIKAIKQDKLIGYLFLSTDIVNIPAYSGKPLVTLIAIDPNGIILGGQVVHHSEPILLVGIPESVLNQFIEQYIGHSITERFEIVSTGFFSQSGKKSTEKTKQEVVKVDMVSGATVTLQVLDQTLITSSRQVAQAIGIIETDSKRMVTWHAEYKKKNWNQLLQEGSISHLNVKTEQMGLAPNNNEAWMDLYFGDVSQPITGINLLGESTYNWLMDTLQTGEKAIFIAANGVSSFKGSGFVRGGIFDRFYIEQGNYKVVFRDLDYEHLYGLEIQEAPKFKESGLFILRHPKFDSSIPWNFYYVANRLTGETAISKVFKTFSTDYQFPKQYFDLVILPNSNSTIKNIWNNKRLDVILLSLFLLTTMLMFLFRDRMTSKLIRLKWLHISVMVISVIYIGIILKSPPSMTHLYPLIRIFEDGFRLDLYLLDPIQFVFWIFIAISLIMWGRGWFCGWICPYGALTELLNNAAKKIFPKKFFYEFPKPIHNILRRLRYVIFSSLVLLSLYSIEWAERAAEIEPFKTTWLVGVFNREWYFMGYWIILLVVSVFIFRFFCRYLCPLGAGFSIGSLFQIKRIKRRGCCTSCKICTRGCESFAINEVGKVNRFECLFCLECEQKYFDDEQCPPLIALANSKKKGTTIDLSQPCKNPDL